MTEHARNLWWEGSHAKALDFLGCVNGITLDHHKEILFGLKKLEGENAFKLVNDNWTPPEGYKGFTQAIQQGENWQELQQYREREAWEVVKQYYDEVRGYKKAMAGLWSRVEKLVGPKRAEVIMNTAMHEAAERRKALLGDCDDEERKEPSGPSYMLKTLYAAAQQQMAENAILAGADPDSVPSADAMMNRGMDIIPKLDPKMESASGWLLPGGKYYGCGSMEHIGLATNLLKDEYPSEGNHEHLAEKLGWMKITKGLTGFRVVCRKKPTKSQQNKLFDYCQHHGRDYEKILQEIIK